MTRTLVRLQRQVDHTTQTGDTCGLATRIRDRQRMFRRSFPDTIAAESYERLSDIIAQSIEERSDSRRKAALEECEGKVGDDLARQRSWIRRAERGTQMGRHEGMATPNASPQHETRRTRGHIAPRHEIARPEYLRRDRHGGMAKSRSLTTGRTTKRVSLAPTTYSRGRQKGSKPGRRARCGLSAAQLYFAFRRLGGERFSELSGVRCVFPCVSVPRSGGWPVESCADPEDPFWAEANIPGPDCLATRSVLPQQEVVLGGVAMGRPVYRGRLAREICSGGTFCIALRCRRGQDRQVGDGTLGSGPREDL